MLFLLFVLVILIFFLYLLVFCFYFLLFPFMIYSVQSERKDLHCMDLVCCFFVVVQQQVVFFWFVLFLYFRSIPFTAQIVPKCWEIKSTGLNIFFWVKFFTCVKICDLNSWLNCQQSCAFFAWIFIPTL